MLQDFRYALRVIARERWVSAVIVGALALGIGVNATGFTLVNGVLLRGRSLIPSRQVYALSWNGPQARHHAFSYPEFEHWRARNRSFVLFAAVVEQTMSVSDDRGLPEQVYGARVTEGAFTVFGQQPQLGRVFTADDRRKEAAPVAVIAHHVWRNRYGGDPKVLGATLRVNGSPAAIVGVMPSGLRFPGNAEIWLPLVPTAAQESRTNRQLLVFARTAPGVSRRQADAESLVIAQELIASYPAETKGFSSVFVESVPDRFVGVEARMMFLVMMTAVTFVLLIACANVANLLLARSAYRTREIALRMVLGATRLRVIRQLLIESVVLGIAGGLLGLLLAHAGVRLFEAAILDNTRPFWIVFAVDFSVAGYVALICILTAIVAGLAPALQVSGRNSSDTMKDGGRGTVGGIRSRRFSSALVVTQLVLTVILLAGAGLMVRSFYNLRAVDIGFNPEHVLTMRLQAPAAKYATAESRRALHEQLESRIAAVPGIDAVALTTVVPPLNGEERDVEVEGRVTGGNPPTVSVVRISLQFFDVLERRMMSGRMLAPADSAAGSPGVLINERFARQLFENENPIGRRIRFVSGQPSARVPKEPWRIIVGISPFIRHSGTRDLLSDAVVYLPLASEPVFSPRIMVRTQLPPATVIDDIRRAVQTIDSDQPVFRVQTIQELLGEQQWPYSAFGGAFAIFALVGLVLASVGLYALMAYSVTQRTAEIGVRMALGANTAAVSWLFLRRGLTQVAIGLTLGLAGAFALTQVLRTTLVGVTSGDPLTFAGAVVVICSVATVACLIPVRRAARVDPAIALRRGDSTC